MAYTGCEWVQLYQDWEVRTAHAICMAESSGNPAGTHVNSNGTVDRGLMAINSVHSDLVGGDLQALYNPRINVQVAHELWLAHGWQPWTTYNDGAYLRFM